MTKYMYITIGELYHCRCTCMTVYAITHKYVTHKYGTGPGSVALEKCVWNVHGEHTYIHTEIQSELLARRPQQGHVI